MKSTLNQIRPDASIAILTGAGISAESGLNTFRGADGLWEGHRVEDVATPEAFARDPAFVHQFYNERRRGLLDAKVRPNPAHLALAELEENWAGAVLVVTQNIDDLHDRAGSKNLIHMHGELLKMFCAGCARGGGGTEFTRKYEIRGDIGHEDFCGACGQEGGMRPDIVWFGEMPYQMDKIFEALADCDLFVSIGTSGNVYPAAGFSMQAKGHGALAVELNLEPSSGASNFDEGLYGPASEIVPGFVRAVLDV